jgi:hypothetical protein
MFHQPSRPGERAFACGRVVPLPEAVRDSLLRAYIGLLCRHRHPLGRITEIQEVGRVLRRCGHQHVEARALHDLHAHAVEGASRRWRGRARGHAYIKAHPVPQVSPRVLDAAARDHDLVVESELQRLVPICAEGHLETCAELATVGGVIAATWEGERDAVRVEIWPDLLDRRKRTNSEADDVRNGVCLVGHFRRVGLVPRGVVCQVIPHHDHPPHDPRSEATGKRDPTTIQQVHVEDSQSVGSNLLGPRAVWNL